MAAANVVISAQSQLDGPGCSTTPQRLPNPGPQASTAIEYFLDTLEGIRWIGGALQTATIWGISAPYRTGELSMCKLAPASVAERPAFKKVEQGLFYSHIKR